MDALVLRNDVAQLRHRSQQVLSTLPIVPKDLPEMPEIVSEGPGQFMQNIRGVLRYLKKVRKALKRAGADESFEKLDSWRRAVTNWHDAVQESPETFVEYERTGKMPIPKITLEWYSSLRSQQQTLVPGHSDVSSTLHESSDESAPSSNAETVHEHEDSTSPASYEFTFPETGAAPSEVYVFSSAESSSQEDEHLEGQSDSNVEESVPPIASDQEPEHKVVLTKDNDVATVGGGEEGGVANDTITAEGSASPEVDPQEPVTVKEPGHEIGTSTSANSSGFTLPQTGTGLSHVFVWMASQEPSQEPVVAKEPEGEVAAIAAPSSFGFTLPQTGTGLSHVFPWLVSHKSSHEDEHSAGEDQEEHQPLVSEQESGDGVVVAEGDDAATTTSDEEGARVEDIVPAEASVAGETNTQGPVTTDPALQDSVEAPIEDPVCEASNNGGDHTADSQNSSRDIESERAAKPDPYSMGDEVSAVDDSTLMEDLTSEAEKAEEESAILPEGSAGVAELAADSIAVKSNDKLALSTTTAANGQACNDDKTTTTTTTVPLHFPKLSPTSVLVSATAGAFMAARFPVVSACMLYAGIAYAKYSLNH
ncbi:hypothetical protein EDD37DRAFT_480696 [Exophiala viscosa]|uniref:uncharacterized protein n=1 Tax=Exophiala viscosa TaxID=2486360 RepID=UPI00219CA00C|nr:hypothetical protein EDD37DRAFT_480696 [Exophiala viscosa]